MADQPIHLTPTGPPETVLPAVPDRLTADLRAAMTEADSAMQRSAVAAIVADHPRYLAGWATLGDLGRSEIERYAYYRVGYHRGLDTLRGAGWRGSGYVRWRHEENRGFLRSVAGLGTMAAAIGEDDEADRCAHFVLQLDPSGDVPGAPAGVG